MKNGGKKHAQHEGQAKIKQYLRRAHYFNIPTTSRHISKALEI